jgi:hypothetical protein
MCILKIINDMYFYVNVSKYPNICEHLNIFLLISYIYQVDANQTDFYDMTLFHPFIE